MSHGPWAKKKSFESLLYMITSGFSLCLDFSLSSPPTWEQSQQTSSCPWHQNLFPTFSHLSCSICSPTETLMTSLPYESHQATSNQRFKALVHFAACTQQLSKALHTKAFGLKALEAIVSMTFTASIHWVWPKLPSNELYIMLLPSMAEFCAIETVNIDLVHTPLVTLVLLWVFNRAPSVTSFKATAQLVMFSTMPTASDQPSITPSQAFTACE